MNPTTVVNLKTHPYTIYIGRANVTMGLPRSPFCNPYPETQYRNRVQSINAFRAYLKAYPELMERVRRELKGEVLGCYCHPKPCHGDVLARVADGGEP
jgi:hypothetical protein